MPRIFAKGYSQHYLVLQSNNQDDIRNYYKKHKLYRYICGYDIQNNEMIARNILDQIVSKIHQSKVILLLGARQVGKTTLLQEVVKLHEQVLWLNADEPDVMALLESANSKRLELFFGNHTLVVIDEAQLIQDIGRKLKLIHDQLKHIQVIATGSSAFELRNKTNEPLTGRKWEFQLFPLSFSEMVKHHGLLEEKRSIPHRLVYGYYPEIITHIGQERERLKLIADSYLYKDILMFQGLKKSEKLIHLLKMLAAQIGTEVNYNRLSRDLQINHETVEKYIQLLEQSFVIFRLPAFSTNQQKELKKGRKIYFFDNGIINTLTGNFSILETRQDKGALWENFVISELYKKHTYEKTYGQFYFWRTHDQQEIDLIIDQNQVLYAHEIKWSPKAKARLSKTFSSKYSNHQFSVIHTENVEAFLL